MGMVVDRVASSGVGVEAARVCSGLVVVGWLGRNRKTKKNGLRRKKEKEREERKEKERRLGFTV